MEFHRGRLIDHIHLRVAELEKSRTFYRAVLSTLGIGFISENERHFCADELYVSAADDPHSEGKYISRVHLAFQAPDRETVARFHAAGLAHGGTDNGAPGDRGYHPGYYGAFLLDPDGNNIEAVWHGPAKRSAPAVILTPEAG